MFRKLSVARCSNLDLKTCRRKIILTANLGTPFQDGLEVFLHFVRLLTPLFEYDSDLLRDTNSNLSSEVLARCGRLGT